MSGAGMRTLADVRRRMTPGTEVDAVNYVRPQASGPRTVVKNQTERICWRMQDGQESWLDWPKARATRIDGPDTVTFLGRGADGTGPLVTFTFRNETTNGEPA